MLAGANIRRQPSSINGHAISIPAKAAQRMLERNVGPGDDSTGDCLSDGFIALQRSGDLCLHTGNFAFRQPRLFEWIQRLFDIAVNQVYDARIERSIRRIFR